MKSGIFITFLLLVGCSNPPQLVQQQPSCEQLQKELDSVKALDGRLLKQAVEDLHKCDSVNVKKKIERDSLLQYMVHYKTVAKSVYLDLQLVLKSRKVVDGKVVYVKKDFFMAWVQRDLRNL